MLQAVIIGIGVGVVIALPTGPLGIFIVQRTIMGGRQIGFAAGMGAVVSDVFYAVLLSIGLRQFVHKLVGIQGWLDILIALVLIGLGLHALRKEYKSRGVLAKLETTPMRAFWGTAVLNFANPQVIITLSAVLLGSGIGRNVRGTNELIAFCIAIVVGTAIWWYGFGRWVEWVTTRTKPVSQELLHRFISWALVVVGIAMLVWGVARLVH